MQEQQLQKQLAKTEFFHDQMQSELLYIDGMLRLLGFEEGLETLKKAAKELVKSETQFEA